MNPEINYKENNSAHRYGRIVRLGFNEAKTNAFLTVKTKSRPGRDDEFHTVVIAAKDEALVKKLEGIKKEIAEFNALPNEKKNETEVNMISVDGFLRPGKDGSLDVVVLDAAKVKFDKALPNAPVPENEVANANSINGILRFENRAKDSDTFRPRIEHLQKSADGKNQSFMLDTFLPETTRSTDAKAFIEALKKGEIAPGDAVNIQGQVFEYKGKAQIEITHGKLLSKKQAKAETEAVEVKVEEPKQAKKAAPKKAAEKKAAPKKQAKKPVQLKVK